MSASNYYATVALPDGRTVTCSLYAPYDASCNAAEIERCTMEWADGRELTDSEYNEELIVNGERYYLHEYVTEQTMLTTPEVSEP